ncbi:hypothetical protein HDU78_001916 [Chytriomyces hyalinus]|nr:hypothetical protein HDU78_001916 [Chytriomyces hyalinus]
MSVPKSRPVEWPSRRHLWGDGMCNVMRRFRTTASCLLQPLELIYLRILGQGKKPPKNLSDAHLDNINYSRQCAIRRMLKADPAVYEKRYAGFIQKIVTDDTMKQYHITLPVDRYRSWKIESISFVLDIPLDIPRPTRGDVSAISDKATDKKPTGWFQFLMYAAEFM